MTEILWNEEPDVVINFGSCGNLKDFKVGEVIEVGEVYNNIDVRPFAEYGCTPENNECEIKLSNSGVKCFSTDQIYDNSRTDYANKYLEMINTCDIVDMECYPLGLCLQKKILRSNPINGYQMMVMLINGKKMCNWFENFKEVLSKVLE